MAVEKDEQGGIDFKRSNQAALDKAAAEHAEIENKIKKQAKGRTPKVSPDEVKSGFEKEAKSSNTDFMSPDKVKIPDEKKPVDKEFTEAVKAKAKAEGTMKMENVKVNDIAQVEIPEICVPIGKGDSMAISAIDTGRGCVVVAQAKDGQLTSTFVPNVKLVERDGINTLIGIR